MNRFIAALAVLVIGVVIAVTATPRSYLPPAVRVAKGHVDSFLGEAGPRAERLVRRAERALDDVRDRIGVPMARTSRSTVSGRAKVSQHADTLEQALGPNQSTSRGYYYGASQDIAVQQDSRWDELIDWMEAQRQRYTDVFRVIEAQATDGTP